MYKVTVQDTYINDETTIYYPGNRDYAVVSAVITYDIGLAGEFNFVIPVTNPSYDRIERNAVITVYENNKEIWRGDIRNIKTNFDKSLSVYAVEDLAWLGEEPVAMTSVTNETYAQRFSAVINTYNNNQTYKRNFTVGQITAQSSSGTCIWQPEYGDSVLSGLRKFIAKENGYLKVRRAYSGNTLTRYIDIVTLADYGKQSTQKVEFGSNLIDFVKDMDVTNLCNALYPYGAETETELYGDLMQRIAGTPIQNNDSIYYYGRRAKTVVFDTEDTTTLNNLASAYLSRYSQPTLTLEIKAVDLGSISNVDTYAIGDSVRVVADVYAVDQWMYITKMHLNMLDAAQNQITLSDEVRNVSLTSQMASQAKELEDMQTPASVLDMAKKNAWAILEGDNGGIVTFDVNGNEQIVGIHIANNLDLSQATKAWGWNINGLVYLHRTYPSDEWQVGIAMTMNGEIVADYITTGSLTADVIKTGTLNAALATIINLNANNITTGHLLADFIQGGTLQLGGNNNTNGVLLIKDASGNTIVTGNKDGLATTNLTATDHSKFGNLEIDKKMVDTPVGEREMAYIYGDGWIEYWYESWEGVLPKTTNKTVYFSPYYDGWSDDLDVNIWFSANDTNWQSSHDTTTLCQVSLARWTGTAWSAVDTLKFNYSGQEINDKDKYFTGFTKNDKTVYRLKMQLIKKSWAEDYDIDVYCDSSHVFELNPYEITGSFRGQLTGSASLYSLSVGDLSIMPSGAITNNDSESDAEYSINYYGFASEKDTNQYTTLSCSSQGLIEAKKSSSEYIKINTNNPSIKAYDSSSEYIDVTTSAIKIHVDSSQYTEIDNSVPSIKAHYSSNDYIDITDNYIEMYRGSNSNSKFSNQTLTATRSGTSYTIPWTASDRRFKEEIESLDVELSKGLIDATETVKFKYKSDEGKHYGVIAQDVREVLDKLGETDSQLEHSMGVENPNVDDPRTVDYHEFIPHLINYVKDLRAEIEALKNIINTLKED